MSFKKLILYIILSYCAILFFIILQSFLKIRLVSEVTFPYIFSIFLLIVKFSRENQRYFNKKEFVLLLFICTVTPLIIPYIFGEKLTFSVMLTQLFITLIYTFFTLKFTKTYVIYKKIINNSTSAETLKVAEALDFKTENVVLSVFIYFILAICCLFIMAGLIVIELPIYQTICHKISDSCDINVIYQIKTFIGFFLISFFISSTASFLNYKNRASRASLFFKITFYFSIFSVLAYFALYLTSNMKTNQEIIAYKKIADIIIFSCVIPSFIGTGITKLLVRRNSQ